MNDIVAPMFRKHFDDLAKRNAKQRGTQLILGTGEPEAAAEGVRLGAELGVPPRAVLGAPEIFRGRAAQKRATTALESAPNLQDWLSDPINGALAKDDLDNLTWFERNLGPAARAAGRGTRRLSAAPDVFTSFDQAGQAMDVGRSYEDILAEEMKNAGVADGGQISGPAASVNTALRMRAIEVATARYDAVAGQGESDRVEHVRRGADALASASRILEISSNIPMSDTATKFRDGTLANAPNTLFGTLGAFVDDPIAGAAFIAETATETLPVLAAATGVTLATRSPGAGAVAMGGGSFLMENTSGAMQFLQEKGVDLSTPEAAAAVLQNRALMAEAGERGLTRGLIIGLFDAVSGGVAGQALMNNPAGEIVVQGIAQIALGSGGEATAQLATTGEIDAREVVIEGLAEFATAPIEVLGVGGRGLIRDTARAGRSGETAALIDQIDEQAAASKLKERSPEKFKEALEAQGQDDQFLYVPADGLQEYLQTVNVGAEEFGLDPLELGEQSLAGGSAAVPISTFAAQISGTDLGTWFRENATREPDEMSLSEAERFNAEVSEIAERAFEEAEGQRVAESDNREAGQRVYDNLTSQLRGAGRTVDVAQNEARVVSSFLSTMAERYGGDAAQMFERFGLTIRGPQSPSVDTSETNKFFQSLQTTEIQIDPETGVSVVNVPGPVPTEIDWKAEIDWLRENLQGKTVEAPGGRPVRISQQSRKALSSNRGNPVKAAVIRSLPDIIASAPIYAEIADTKGRENLRFAYAAGAVVVDGTEYSVGLRYRVDGEGSAIAYQLEGYELQPGGSISADASGRPSQPSPDRKINIGQLVDSFKNEPLFQDDVRGSIEFPNGGLEDGQTVINLFESADLSTFLHESGHYFLEAFSTLAADPTAPDALQFDMAAIRKYLGVQDGEVFETRHHEKWARGFEAYLMEGRAPSLELADAFGRFKAWLTRIYKSIAGLNVKLSPEIREVMDRMLATDAEITAARAEQEMGPLFIEAPVGMSAADWSTYQRMARGSEEEASQALFEKTMAKVRREKAKWYREEKKAVRAEVSKTVSARPVYLLTEMLANKRVIGDPDAEIHDIQINRTDLVEMFGEGVLAELSRSHLGGKRAVYSNEGSTPGEVAEFFGFRGPIEMVETLRVAGKRKDAINAEVERVMLERHGDPLHDGTIEEEALAAIHNEQQTNTAVSEARHMARQIGRDTRAMKAKIYRLRAKQMIGRMSVSAASRSNAFLAAERKAARAAQDAFARVARGGGAQDIAAALQAKEQQILNGFLYNESRAVAAEVAKGRERMRRYNKPSVREKLEGGYIDQIDAILADYDFRVRSGPQVNRTESLRGFMDRMIEDGREAELAIDERLTDGAKRKHYTRLSVGELRGLFDTVANIDHLGRFKQKLIEANRKRELLASAESVAQAVRDNFGTGKTKQESRIRSTLNLLWTTDTMLVEMDGGDEMGAAYSEIKQSVDDGQNLEQKMSVELAQKLEDVFSVFSAAELAEMKKEKAINGANHRAWSKLEIMSVALNTGNTDNMERLLARDAHQDYRLDKTQVDALLDTMTQKEWEFVQSMWDLINGYWPQISAVTERRTGVRPKKVDATPVVTKYGTFAGGYYPIRYDPALSRNANLDEASAFDTFISAGRSGKAQTANGHTISRQKTGNNRTLQFDMSVAFSHLRDVVRDISMSEAIDNSYRILNHPVVVDAFINAGRMNDHKVLGLWLKDTAKGPIYNTDVINSLARIIKNNFTLSRLAFNMKTVVLQATGLGQSAVTVGKKNMVRGILEYRKRPKELAAEVVKKSAFMAERQSTFQKDIYDFANDAKVASPLASRWTKGKTELAKWGFAPIVKMQFWAVDMPTWLAGYHAGIERFGNEEKAIRYADRMVARSQDSGLMGDRNAVSRGTVSETIRQADFIRLFTTLAGYMMTKMNRGNLTLQRGVRGVKEAESPTDALAAVANTATDVALLYVLEAALMAILYTALADEDIDDEDYAEFLMRETGSAVFGGIPFIRDGVSAFNGYGGGGVYGSVLEVPASLWTQAMQGENDKALRRSIGDLVGIATGLPSTATMRVVEGIANPDEVSPAEALFGTNPLTR